MSNLGTFEQRISQTKALEAKIDAIKADQKAVLAPYIAAQEKLRALLLHMLNTSGQESAKTALGTVYKTQRNTVKIENHDEFMRHVIGAEAWELLDWKANKTAVMDYAAINQGQLPPGLALSIMLDIGVLAPKKAKAAVTSQGNGQGNEEATEDQNEAE